MHTYLFSLSQRFFETKRTDGRLPEKLNLLHATNSSSCNHFFIFSSPLHSFFIGTQRRKMKNNREDRDRNHFFVWDTFSNLFKPYFVFYMAAVIPILCSPLISGSLGSMVSFWADDDAMIMMTVHASYISFPSLERHRILRYYHPNTTSATLLFPFRYSHHHYYHPTIPGRNRHHQNLLPTTNLHLFVSSHLRTSTDFCHAGLPKLQKHFLPLSNKIHINIKW